MNFQQKRKKELTSLEKFMLGRSFGSVDEYSQFIAPSEKYAGHLSQDTVFERFVSDSPPEFREFLYKCFHSENLTGCRSFFYSHARFEIARF